MANLKQSNIGSTLSKYKWKGALLITISIPTVYLLFFPQLYGDTLKCFVQGALFSGVLTILIWTGCEWIDNILEKKLPWKSNPGRRAMLQLGIVTLFALLVSWIVFELKLDPEHSSQMHFLSNSIITVAITLAINLIGIGRFFIIELKNSIKENEELKKENIQSQFDSLKNQVNPHFLFNCLNTLSGIIEEKPKYAVDFVSNMASVYRYLLIQNNNSTASVGEELKFLESYLYLNKVRFENALQYSISISETSKQKQIANLSMQILVENAIKHNIIMETRPLKIEIFEENDYLVVRNNLQKKESVISTGTGLSNITNRYHLLNADREVVIDENETYFTVKIPLL